MPAPMIKQSVKASEARIEPPTGSWMGLPYRGPATHIKPTDGPDRQPRLKVTKHAVILHLDTKDGMAAYNDMLAKESEALSAARAAGTMDQSFGFLQEDLQYNQRTGKRSLFVKYYEACYVAPEKS